MAKLYDFNITIRKAEFKNNLVIVPAGTSADVYAEKNVEMTLSDAIDERQRMSDAEPRSHVGNIKMRYRDDRKAPGIANVRQLEKEAVA